MQTIQTQLKRNFLISFLLFLIGLAGGYYFLVIIPNQIGETRVAVAANFTAPMKKLITLFQDETRHKVFADYGATGQLYKQIQNGERFDIFLAADTQHPQLLAQQGHTVPNTHFVYAIGQLVLWSNQPDFVDQQGEILRTDQFQHLAIAPVDKAPYGKAAKQTLEKMGLWETLWPRITQGIDLPHTYRLIAEGETQLGFIARSQLTAEDQGSLWIVPQSLYTPLENSVVLLKQGIDNKAALDFLTFLKGDTARQVIKEFSYEVP